MSGEYVPMAQRTPEQRDAYRASCRERNRRYYARKKAFAEAVKKELHGFALDPDSVSVACVKCGIDTVPVCGFCKDGIATN
jgi:hypothetical protein